MKRGAGALWERHEVVLEWQQWLMTSLHMPSVWRRSVRQESAAQQRLDDAELSKLLRDNQELNARLQQPQQDPTAQECSVWGNQACRELASGFLFGASAQSQAQPLEWELP
jgi:hypothetical protein